MYVLLRVSAQSAKADERERHASTRERDPKKHMHPSNDKKTKRPPPREVRVTIYVDVYPAVGTASMFRALFQGQALRYVIPNFWDAMRRLVNGVYRLYTLGMSCPLAVSLVART